MTATECINFERNYKLARQRIDMINDTWAKFLIQLPRRIWINTKTNEFTVEYKFAGDWQTANEISEQTLQIYKVSEELYEKTMKGNW